MADMLEWGEKYLRDKRLEFMSTDVVYIMSEGTTFHVKAAVGQHFYRQMTVDGLSLATRSVDFIINAELMQREPKVGDTIVYKGHRFAVTAPSREPAWDWSGFQHEAYRVHTFCKGEDTLNRVVINPEV